MGHSIRLVIYVVVVFMLFHYLTHFSSFTHFHSLSHFTVINSHNTEKVIYFLLMDRKRRKPSYEDETECIIRNRSESGNSVIYLPLQTINENN